MVNKVARLDAPMGLRTNALMALGSTIFVVFAGGAARSVVLA